MNAFTAAIPPFGVTADILLEEADGTAHFLAFGRHSSAGWILLLRTQPIGSFEYDQIPISNASRRLRVLAAANLERLLDALRAAAVAEAQRLESLEARVREATRALKEGHTS